MATQLLCLFSKHRQLFVAAEDGDAEKVHALLSAGANVNYKYLIFWTPLTWSACHGQLNVVKALLAHKASVDLPNKAQVLYVWLHLRGIWKLSEYYLHMAHMSTLQTLTEKLHYTQAASAGRLEIVKVLLDHGASIDLPDNVV
ncbi:unnamed protein product [Aphanomyces euteiches]